MNDLEIREKLLARRAELDARSGRVRADLAHTFDPLAADFEEQATQRENDEVLSAVGDSADAEIALINRALARLERGEYGRCTKCGATIEARRLEAVPFADRCMNCAV